MKRSRMNMLVLGAAFGAAVTIGGSAGAARSKTAPRSTATDPVESRIAQLHQELRITAAQETQWNQVAQQMRDNGKALADLRDKQAGDAKTLGAVDALERYADVIDAHASAVHKLIPAFRTLYDGMSDAQKKTADAVFRARVTAATKKHT